MLAIEVVFAGADPVPVMVFDEVDAGVGGQAAGEIGRRLARLARDHQVVVVTHLAQVAAFADTHLVVDKSPTPAPGSPPPTSGRSRARTASASWPGCSRGSPTATPGRRTPASCWRWPPPRAADPSRGCPACGAHRTGEPGRARPTAGVGMADDAASPRPTSRRTTASRSACCWSTTARSCTGSRRASSSSAPATPPRSARSSRAIPDLRVRSFDISASSVEAARANIAARGVADRYTVELGDFFDQADAVGGPR